MITCLPIWSFRLLLCKMNRNYCLWVRRWIKWCRYLAPLSFAICCLALNLHLAMGIPTINKTDYLELFKYERHFHQDETTTMTSNPALQEHSKRPAGHERLLPSEGSGHQPDSDLYTLQLGQHTERQLKHDDIDLYDFKCPKQHYIHPCDCMELDKRLEMMEGSGDVPDASSNSTPTVEMVEEEPLNGNFIETVSFCKNIRNVQVLTEAIRGFQGHRINYFVLDGCKLPPFPNNLFQGIHIVWMEILNSTLQFHDSFFNTKSCP